MANVPTLGEDYVTFGIDITTITEGESDSKDILNSSKTGSLDPEGLVNDAIGTGDRLFGFE